jgi:antitoxin VapB
MTTIPKIFMDDGLQAVCLPDECRFEGTEVRISKVGDKVILEPLAGGRDFLPDGAPDDPPVEPDPRVFDE